MLIVFIFLTSPPPPHGTPSRPFWREEVLNYLLDINATALAPTIPRAAPRAP